MSRSGKKNARSIALSLVLPVDDNKNHNLILLIARKIMRTISGSIDDRNVKFVEMKTTREQEFTIQ